MTDYNLPLYPQFPDLRETITAVHVRTAVRRLRVDGVDVFKSIGMYRADIHADVAEDLCRTKEVESVFDYQAIRGERTPGLPLWPRGTAPSIYGVKFFIYEDGDKPPFPLTHGLVFFTSSTADPERTYSTTVYGRIDE